MKFAYLIVLFGLLSSCSNDKEEVSTLFRKVDSLESGLSFSNDLEVNLATKHNVYAHQYYYRGAGVAMGDINKDGLQDVFLTANSGKSKLFLNKGNLKFDDVSTTAGIENLGWSTGVVMVDINNDGNIDIYVCQAGPDEGVFRQNLLYINNGDNSFTESAKAYGLNDENLSRNAGFFDYDRDGDLDCYVLNESIYPRKSYSYISKKLEDKENLRKCSGKLFRNNGNNTFTDVTESAGVLSFGFGLSLNISDINNDGWQDLYVSNDFEIPDKIFINQGDGTFLDEIKEKTKNISWASMGLDIADINNDQMVDVFTVEMASKDHYMDKTLMPSMNKDLFNSLITDFGYQRQYKFNSLQLNNGNGTFSNVAALAGLLKSEWSWSTLLADFDNDGYKDCFITNGLRLYYTDKDSQKKLKNIRSENKGLISLEKRKEFYKTLPERKSRNLVFRNSGDLRFEDYSKKWGLGDMSFSNGTAYADLDNDGDLDLIVNNIDQEAFLYENTSRDNNYLKIELESEQPIIGTKAIFRM